MTFFFFLRFQLHFNTIANVTTISVGSQAVSFEYFMMHDSASTKCLQRHVPSSVDSFLRSNIKHSNSLSYLLLATTIYF